MAHRSQATATALATAGSLPPLLVALLLLLATTASAAATVTGASCAVDANGSCVNTTVTFSGTDLADVTAVRIGLTSSDEALITCGSVTAAATTVSCTLAVALAARTGLFPATLVLSNATELEAGSLLIGAFYEQTSLPRWTSTTNSSGHRVAGQSTSWPSTGDTWSVTGTFNPASSYSIIFYNYQSAAAAENPSMPSCTPVAVTAATLTCTITAANGVMGMYGFLVRDTTTDALLLGSTSLSRIAVNPPLPVVTGASGDCASSSAACVSGATLTIAGTNFNYRSPAYQKFYVGVTSAQRSAIQLTPTAVSKTNITATLAIAGNVAAGSYPIFVKVQVCMSGMMTPVHYVGNLVLKNRNATVAGFNTNEMNGETTVQPEYVEVDAFENRFKAAMAFAIVFAILFLALFITLVVICCRCSLVSKKQVRREMDYGGPQAEMRADSTVSTHYNGATTLKY